MGKRKGKERERERTYACAKGCQLKMLAVVLTHYFWAVRELGTFLLPFLYFSAVSEFFSVRTYKFYKHVLGKFLKIGK